MRRKIKNIMNIRDIILEKKKQYYKNNVDVKSEYNKQYAEANKEKIREYRKQYNEANKNREKHTCDCGAVIQRKSLTRHIKSKKHLSYIKQIEPT